MGSNVCTRSRLREAATGMSLELTATCARTLIPDRGNMEPTEPLCTVSSTDTATRMGASATGPTGLSGKHSGIFLRRGYRCRLTHRWISHDPLCRAVDLGDDGCHNRPQPVACRSLW